MIGIIGPVLYLTKGQQLIIKNTREPRRPQQIFSYYLNLIQNLSSYIKVLFGISITLILLGYSVRLFNIFFFWESESVGYIILGISLVLLLNEDIKSRKASQLKTSWHYVGFWGILFILVTHVALTLIFLNSDAYNASKSYFQNDSDIIEALGEIEGYSIFPNGQIQTFNDNGIANINMIIKGRKKYKEVTVHLEKNTGHDWKIISIE